jgi:hypothetical protein
MLCLLWATNCKFRQLNKQWPLIDKSNFVPLSKDRKGCSLTDSEKVWLEQNHQVAVRVLCAQLSRDNQPRQDYLEFIKLSLVALDEDSRIGDGNSIHTR